MGCRCSLAVLARSDPLPRFIRVLVSGRGLRASPSGGGVKRPLVGILATPAVLALEATTVMAHAPATRSEYVRALPKLSDAAKMIGLDASGITRAMQRLDIEPLRWGGRDKHLAVADVLRIASSAQRASLEEVAGNLLTWAEREHPEHVDAFTSEVDAFCAALPAPAASEPDAFVAGCAPRYRSAGLQRPSGSGARTSAIRPARLRSRPNGVAGATKTIDR